MWTKIGSVVLVLTATTAGAAQLGDPIPRLTPTQAQRFLDAKAVFEETEGAEDGLGPVFNDVGCAACHNVGATGGGSALVETRFGTTTAAGAFDPLTQFGGSLIQVKGIGPSGTCDFGGEVVPDQATIRAGRRTTPLFGLGLVDAVPDTTFKSLARNQARFTPQTAGRPNMVTDVVSGTVRVGKFGWKSQVPNLMHFSGDAYLNEMGITSPLFPTENCPGGDCSLLSCDLVPDPEDDGEDVEAFHDFMTLLGPPPRARTTAAVLAGSFLFDRIGCDNCHVRSLTTGPSRVGALAFKTFQPYSDFLLHDMGALGDGIEQGRATGNEMRTAPLWGVRIMTSFLHDGSAATIEDAILAHDGQGRGARNRFANLSPTQQARLLAFVNSL